MKIIGVNSYLKYSINYEKTQKQLYIIYRLASSYATLKLLAPGKGTSCEGK